MDRLSELLARPSAWAGLLGLALLLSVLGWAGYDKLVPPRGAECPSVQPSGPADHMRILDIGAPELELRGSLCLVVDNVVSESLLRARQAAVAAARRDLAAVQQAASETAKPAVPVVHYSPRFGRYVTKPVTTAAASTESSESARLRRTAASAKLAAAEAALAELTRPRRLALFLNGERAAAEPRTVRGDAAPQPVVFALTPEQSAAGERSAYWRRLLGLRGENGLVPVTVGIAEEAQQLPAVTMRTTPARNGGTSVPLAFRVYRPAIMWLAGAGLVLTLLGLAGIARAGALLRDGRSRYSSYSLGRVQMAWWFALAIGGFLYIWLVTGQYLDVVGSATFVLLGIAGATAGAARAVDPPRTGTETLTRGFFADISGGERIEMHRLQMIAWTLVLGGIYAWNVLVNFTLTDFDANLLALAAVVNGVYVGLKTQEA